MRRLERRRGKSRELWEIELDGRQYTIRHGKVGTSGRLETKTHSHSHMALYDAKAKVQAKLRKGFVEVDIPRAPLAPDPIPRNPELEAALGDDLADADLWMLYADWLQTHDAALGERIALSLRPGLGDAIARLDERMREAWYTPTLLRLLARHDAQSSVEFQLTHGFVTRARLVVSDGLDLDPTPALVLAALVRAPVGRLLHELSIESSWEGCHESLWSPGDVGKCLLALAEAGKVASLRSLHVGKHDERMGIVGDLGAVVRAMPRLERLRVYGLDVQIDALDHPSLRELGVTAADGEAALVRTLGVARLPSCTDLDLVISLDEAADIDIDVLGPLLAGVGTPKLERLRVWIDCLQDDFVRELARSPLLAQLRVLELAHGFLDDHVQLSDRGVEAILDHAQRFARLEQLVVFGHDCWEIRERLRARLPGVEVVG